MIPPSSNYEDLPHSLFPDCCGVCHWFNTREEDTACYHPDHISELRSGKQTYQLASDCEWDSKCRLFQRRTTREETDFGFF